MQKAAYLRSSERLHSMARNDLVRLLPPNISKRIVSNQPRESCSCSYMCNYNKVDIHGGVLLAPHYKGRVRFASCGLNRRERQTTASANTQLDAGFSGGIFPVEQASAIDRTDKLDSEPRHRPLHRKAQGTRHRSGKRLKIPAKE